MRSGSITPGSATLVGTEYEVLVWMNGAQFKTSTTCRRRSMPTRQTLPRVGGCGWPWWRSNDSRVSECAEIDPDRKR